MPRGGRKIELQYDFVADTVTLSGRFGQESVERVATTLAKERLRMEVVVRAPSAD